jgi:hypothetical protein
MAAVMIGDRPAQGLAYGGGDRRGRVAAWRAAGAGLGVAARQLVAVGERVLDDQPRLGARVRLLAAGASNKKDPGEAGLSRSRRCPQPPGTR